MSGNLVHVEFDWSDEFGNCEDCGRPAAYRVGTKHYSRPLCSVCTADAVYSGDGDILEWFFEDDPDVAVQQAMLASGRSVLGPR